MEEIKNKINNLQEIDTNKYIKCICNENGFYIDYEFLTQKTDLLLTDIFTLNNQIKELKEIVK